MAQQAEQFYEGVRLFNSGAYWHAHEQWEHCWLSVEGQEALFYQALIQAAAALVKWQQGNLRGLALNWAKSRAKLEQLPPTVADCDLVKLRAEMDYLVTHPAAFPPTLHLIAP
jgi:predicted metal-dependent hydrolase